MRPPLVLLPLLCLLVARVHAQRVRLSWHGDPDELHLSLHVKALPGQNVSVPAAQLLLSLWDESSSSEVPYDGPAYMVLKEFVPESHHTFSVSLLFPLRAASWYRVRLKELLVRWEEGGGEILSVRPDAELRFRAPESSSPLAKRRSLPSPPAQHHTSRRRAVGAYTTVACSGTRIASFPNTLGILDTAVDDTLAYMRGPCRGTPYATWFGARNIARETYVTNIMANVRSLLSTSFVLRCGTTAPTECGTGNVLAYVYPSDATHTVYLCVAYFSQTDVRTGNSRANTLMHEFAHFNFLPNNPAFGTQATTDFSTPWNGYGEAGAQMYASLRPQDAVRNAESYGWFLAYGPYPCTSTTGSTTTAATTRAPTVAPTSGSPTTQIPTTVAPTTQAPTTVSPTLAVNAGQPTTQAPTTLAPTTSSPTLIPGRGCPNTELVPSEVPGILLEVRYELDFQRLTESACNAIKDDFVSFFNAGSATHIIFLADVYEGSTVALYHVVNGQARWDEINAALNNGDALDPVRQQLAASGLPTILSFTQRGAPIVTSGDGAPLGLIIGAVIGGLLLAALIVVLLVLVLRNRSSSDPVFDRTVSAPAFKQQQTPVPQQQQQHAPEQRFSPVQHHVTSVPMPPQQHYPQPPQPPQPPQQRYPQPPQPQQQQHRYPQPQHTQFHPKPVPLPPAPSPRAHLPMPPVPPTKRRMPPKTKLKVKRKLPPRTKLKVKRKVVRAAAPAPPPKMPAPFALMQGEQSGVALYNYDANSEREVSMRKGEKFAVISITGEWALIRTVNKRAHVPAAYIRVE